MMHAERYWRVDPHRIIECMLKRGNVWRRRYEEIGREADGMSKLIASLANQRDNAVLRMHRAENERDEAFRALSVATEGGWLAVCPYCTTTLICDGPATLDLALAALREHLAECQQNKPLRAALKQLREAKREEDENGSL